MAAKCLAATAFVVLLLAFAAPKASAFSFFPDVFRCWNAVAEVEDCAVKLVPAFLSLHIRLTPQCCKAVLDIEESCLPIVFTNPTLGPALKNVTSSICSALSGSSGSAGSSVSSPAPQAELVF
ncbi:hypothetical protein HPP92_021360 [Vanilla planifolia]|uniref:Prolamin-like domain-containing protein n=1 Tax=Vanilla planifolia TaxID=51239 RepID=A0A835Q4G2_VANPL|nr:hypothetical protein HPP92_021360 [Vanilla planifolia]